MDQPFSRREFVKGSLAMAAGATLGNAAIGAEAPIRPENDESPQADSHLEWRNRNPRMRYRRLGRTNFMISEIVCGGDPIAPDNYRHVQVAIDMGLNYLDTAPAYGHGASEEGYGKVIANGVRQKIFLTTKVDPMLPNRFQAYLKVFEGLSLKEQGAVLAEANESIQQRRATLPNYMGHYFTTQLRQQEQASICDVLEKRYASKIDRPQVYTATIIQSLEGSLRRLGTDHVDLLLCPHGANTPIEAQIPEVFEAFHTLKQQGKVRFLGLSSHNDPAGVLKAAVDTGIYSMAMVAYNIMNRHYVEPVIEHAFEKNFGVIAMKTSQAVYNPDRSTVPVPERAAYLNNAVPGDMGLHQKAYTLALRNPHISAIISNLVNEQQVRENIVVAQNGVGVGLSGSGG